MALQSAVLLSSLSAPAAFFLKPRLAIASNMSKTDATSDSAIQPDSRIATLRRVLF